MKLQIAIDGKTYDLEVEITEDDYAPRGRGYLPPYPETPTTISLPGAVPTKPVAPVAEGPVEEGKVCRSPVAGMVIRINVEVGQEVKRDDLVAVLEAMKMETNVTASAPGKVKSIKVGQGDGVKVNQVLVEFE